MFIEHDFLNQWQRKNIMFIFNHNCKLPRLVKVVWWRGAPHAIRFRPIRSLDQRPTSTDHMIKLMCSHKQSSVSNIWSNYKINCLTYNSSGRTTKREGERSLLPCNVKSCNRLCKKHSFNSKYATKYRINKTTRKCYTPTAPTVCTVCLHVALLKIEKYFYFLKSKNRLLCSNVKKLLKISIKNLLHFLFSGIFGNCVYQFAFSCALVEARRLISAKSLHR